MDWPDYHGDPGGESVAYVVAVYCGGSLGSYEANGTWRQWGASYGFEKSPVRTSRTQHVAEVALFERANDFCEVFSKRRVDRSKGPELYHVHRRRRTHVAAGNLLSSFSGLKPPGFQVGQRVFCRRCVSVLSSRCLTIKSEERETWTADVLADMRSFGSHVGEQLTVTDLNTHLARTLVWAECELGTRRKIVTSQVKSHFNLRV